MMVSEESQAEPARAHNLGDEEQQQQRNGHIVPNQELFVGRFELLVTRIWGPVSENRKSSSYTSSAFLRFPEPMPVNDILNSLSPARIIWRLVYRFICTSLGFYSLTGPNFLLGITLLYFIYSLLNLRFETLPSPWRVTKPVFHLLYLDRLFLEIIASKLLLMADKPKRTMFWWYCYFFVASSQEFETNYMNAWNEHITNPPNTMMIFMEDEALKIPSLEGDLYDRTRLKHLRMFYHLLKLRRGIVELIIPRTLIRIDWVKIDTESHSLGERLETIDLGRRNGTQVALFHDFSHVGEHDMKIKDQMRRISNSHAMASIGIEFVRRYNRTAIIRIISMPLFASIIFALIWMVIFLKRNDDTKDPQVIVTTAFTGALYLVTSGALGIALVAYLDSTTDDESPKLRDVVEAITSIRPNNVNVTREGETVASGAHIDAR